MYTLGISCYYHDSAAAVLKNGKVIAAIEEERFSRIKFDDGFPKLAINWCLKEAGISVENIDSIHISLNIENKISNSNPPFPKYKPRNKITESPKETWIVFVRDCRIVFIFINILFFFSNFKQFF